MKFRVQYLDQASQQIARFAWMERADAIEIARQIIADGDKEVQIEDEAHRLWSPDSLAGAE